MPPLRGAPFSLRESVDLVPQSARPLERHHPSGRKQHAFPRCRVPPTPLLFLPDTKFSEPADQDIFSRGEPGLDDLYEGFNELSRLETAVSVCFGQRTNQVLFGQSHGPAVPLQGGCGKFDSLFAQLTVSMRFLSRNLFSKFRRQRDRSIAGLFFLPSRPANMGIPRLSKIFEQLHIKMFSNLNGIFRG